MIPTPSLFFTGVGHVEFGETALPVPGPGDDVSKTSLPTISARAAARRAGRVHDHGVPLVNGPAHSA